MDGIVYTTWQREVHISEVLLPMLRKMYEKEISFKRYEATQEEGQVQSSDEQTDD